MAKQSKHVQSKHFAPKSGSYRVAGTTSDGVLILSPKTKSAKFTLTDVKKATAGARSDRSGTRALAVNPGGKPNR